MYTHSDKNNNNNNTNNNDNNNDNDNNGARLRGPREVNLDELEDARWPSLICIYKHGLKRSKIKMSDLHKKALKMVLWRSEF